MKDSENNYIKTNKIPGYNELVESMETVAQEATLVNGIEEILSTTAKQGEDTGATLTDVQTSVEGIDETLTVALDEFLGDVSGYTSNKEIYDKLTDENYGLEAIKNAVDNIELDTSDLAKQGPDTAVTLTSVDEKIDGFYNTFDADIASQLQEIIGDSTTGLTGTTQTEEQVSTLRTLQESYDRLAGNMQSLADSWEAMVVRKNTLQGRYVFSDYTIAENVSDVLSKSGELIEIDDDSIVAMPTNVNVFAVNNPYPVFPKLKVLRLKNFNDHNAGYFCRDFSALEELDIRSCVNVSTLAELCARCGNLKKLNVLSGTGFPQDYYFLYGTVNLIDIIIGKNFVSGSGVRMWDPTNALDASSSSLVEEGESFANNREKLLYNIREHIAANLQDRTGTTSWTIVFTPNVKAAIQADQATADAFANKNWTVA